MNKANSDSNNVLLELVKYIECKYKEFIDITGVYDFKTFADDSFKYIITASTGTCDAHTYRVDSYHSKLIVREEKGIISEVFVTDHVEFFNVNYKEI